jgi:hypothetical protein
VSSLRRLIPPAMQQRQQSALVDPELLQRLASGVRGKGAARRDR